MVAGGRPAAPRVAPSRSRPADYRGPAIIATGLVALAVLAVFLLPRLLGADGRVPGASASASAGPSASPSATALPSGLEAMLAAVGRVDAAIDAAQGGKDGLSGKDANELAQLATSVRTALDRGDVGAAATAARTLSDRADALTKGLDKRRRDSLLTAIDDLVAAVSSG